MQICRSAPILPRSSLFLANECVPSANAQSDMAASLGTPAHPCWPQTLADRLDIACSPPQADGHTPAQRLPPSPSTFLPTRPAERKPPSIALLACSPRRQPAHVVVVVNGRGVVSPPTDRSRRRQLARSDPSSPHPTPPLLLLLSGPNILRTRPHLHRPPTNTLDRPLQNRLRSVRNRARGRPRDGDVRPRVQGEEGQGEGCCVRSCPYVLFPSLLSLNIRSFSDPPSAD